MVIMVNWGIKINSGFFCLSKVICMAFVLKLRDNGAYWLGINWFANKLNMNSKKLKRGHG